MPQAAYDTALERLRQAHLRGQQNHSPEGWFTLLLNAVSEVGKTINEGKITDDEYRQRLIEVAATAQAAAESFERNEGKLK